MKKKIVAGLLVLSFALTGVAMAASAISIFVDGKQVPSDVEPFVKNGRTMVPLRVIAEQLGAQVNWDPSSNSVLIEPNKKLIDKTNLRAKSEIQYQLYLLSLSNSFIEVAIPNKTNPYSLLDSASKIIEQAKSRENYLKQTLVSANSETLGFYNKLVEIRAGLENITKGLVGNLPVSGTDENYNRLKIFTSDSVDYQTEINTLMQSIYASDFKELN